VAKTEKETIDEIIDAISELGAQEITCDWIDARGGYVVVVDFGDNQKCQAVDANRLNAYSSAHNVAIMKKASMP